MGTVEGQEMNGAGGTGESNGGAGTSEASSFDMGAAVASITDGLGFGEAKTGEGQNEGTPPPAEGKGAEAAPPPADTPPPPPAYMQNEAYKLLLNEQGVPKTWRQEAAAEFAKLPPVVQDEILKREADIFKGIEGYKADAAYGNTLRQTLEPYTKFYQQRGLQAEAQLPALFEAQATLAFGTPEQKMAMLQNLAKTYNVPFEAAEEPYVDPQVADLRQQLQALQSTMTQTQQAQLQAKRQEVERTVVAFANDPKNIYFEELAKDIADILQTGRASSIEAAYEQALWSNPAVRTKEIARQQAEQAAAAKKAAEEHAKTAAKATAANVKSSAKSGSAATATGSMDDTLRETLAEIKARQG